MGVPPMTWPGRPCYFIRHDENLYAMTKTWRVAGINFDHMHMGDLLRMTFEHPNAQIVGVCDEQPARMQSAIENFRLPAACAFADYRKCIEATKPDLVILCPATAHH